jgi:hypothetical protein
MPTLRSFAERFCLNAGGLQVWTPYWINLPEKPFWLNAAYRGKGTPGQLGYAVCRLLELDPSKPLDSEVVRVFMRGHGLGVDCSGFVYYVLDQWLQQQGARLAQFLVVDREEIFGRNRRQASLARLWADRPVSDRMSLADACAIWRTNPVYITNVRRLLDRDVVTSIVRAGDVHAGDMIGMTNKRGEDHIGLVLELRDGVIVYADSALEKVGLGGVKIREIKVLDPSLGLSYQEWEQKYLFHPSTTDRIDGVWRLRVLSE